MTADNGEKPEAAPDGPGDRGAPSRKGALKPSKKPEKSTGGETGGETGGASDREVRLAEALRANLRRRKAKQSDGRSRVTGKADDGRDPLISRNRRKPDNET